MSEGEWRSLGKASQDPAVTFLLLLPLGLLHLFGRDEANSAAFGVVIQALERGGELAFWGLGTGLGILLLWSIGRIRELGLPWRGGAVLALGEGVLWGLALGPVLRWLTDLVSIEYGPLTLAAQLPEGLRGRLALAAGAGLYEEFLFRAVLMGGLAVSLRWLLTAIGWQEAARTVAFGLALLLSAGGFALAHAWGDLYALEEQVLAFRFLAGVLLGALFAWRGLAVVAYAHATYDALLLI